MLPGEVTPKPLGDALLSGRPETHERMAAYGLLADLISKIRDDLSLAGLVKDELGRPYFPEYPNLYVSVAHTKGAVAAAVSSNRRVGIDVEAAVSYDPDVGEMVLTSEQRTAIEREPNPANSFLRIWTRKEAVGKAVGLGITEAVLSSPVEQSTVRLHGVHLALRDLVAPNGCFAALAVEGNVRGKRLGSE